MPAANPSPTSTARAQDCKLNEVTDLCRHDDIRRSQTLAADVRLGFRPARDIIPEEAQPVLCRAGQLVRRTTPSSPNPIPRQTRPGESRGERAGAVIRTGPRDNIGPKDPVSQSYLYLIYSLDVWSRVISSTLSEWAKSARTGDG